MQQQLFVEQKDFSGKRIMIGLSGGINSMAVLCWLAQYPEHLKPSELYLFYAHLEEHSPDTEAFVLAGVEYAKRNFVKVVYKQSNASVLEYFRKQKMIPHPRLSPCTFALKIEPMLTFMVENELTIDLVGYIRTEKRRVFNMAAKSGGGYEDNSVTIKGIEKHFPISNQDDEWCFSIVEKFIGWYPKIYSIKDKRGKRVFKHNNCLPCKNFREKDYEATRKHYPEYMEKADQLAEDLNLYWGRNKTDAECNYCAFD